MNKQLEDQSVLFANSERYVQFDLASEQLMLSPLLNWYGDDWQPVSGCLTWLAAGVRDPNVVTKIELASAGQLRVGFLDYDWSLNSQSPATGHDSLLKPGKKSEFGSGSIPNE